MTDKLLKDADTQPEPRDSRPAPDQVRQFLAGLSRSRVTGRSGSRGKVKSGAKSRASLRRRRFRRNLVCASPNGDSGWQPNCFGTPSTPLSCALGGAAEACAMVSIGARREPLKSATIYQTTQTEEIVIKVLNHQKRSHSQIHDHPLLLRHGLWAAKIDDQIIPELVEGMADT